MANDDDDILTGPVPPPDAEATASERAHARTFAELVDKTLAGRTPAAISADDRALLDVATVIRAATTEVELDVAKRDALVEHALRHGLGGGLGGAGASARITPIGRRRAWAPWAIAATTSLVAAAAVAALWVRAPRRIEVPTAAVLPTAWKSRPADPLFGPIARDRAGDASGRIDAIFADRLDGYRERTGAAPAGRRHRGAGAKP